MIRQPSYALALFADGQPKTKLQVAALACVATQKAGADIHSLKKRGLIEICQPRPVKNWAYSITIEGLAHLRKSEADTQTSRIFEAFLSDEPLSASQVESATGVDRKRVLNIARRLELRGMLSAIREWRNVRWTITDAGRAVLSSRDAEPETLDAEATVENAKRTRPALEMFWGAMA
jgi:DNA-binding MarR family transcriptional regulator